MACTPVSTVTPGTCATKSFYTWVVSIAADAGLLPGALASLRTGRLPLPIGQEGKGRASHLTFAFGPYPNLSPDLSGLILLSESKLTVGRDPRATALSWSCLTVSAPTGDSQGVQGREMGHKVILGKNSLGGPRGGRRLSTVGNLWRSGFRRYTETEFLSIYFYLYFCLYFVLFLKQGLSLSTWLGLELTK